MQPQDYARSSVSSRGQQGELTPLPDGRWQARYRDNGRQGKRPQRTFVTRKEAAAWLRERLAEVQAGANDPRVQIRQREATRTVTSTLHDYLAAHEATDATLAKLAQQLKHARAAFGARSLQSLETFELQAWKKTLPAGSRHDVFRAFKQVLAQAVRWHWLTANPADGIPNPKPRVNEVHPPAWETVLQVAAEIDDRYAALPVFAAGTGLRPQEWIALERRDIDLDARLVRVRRVHSQGRLLELGADGSKSWRQRRAVPLRDVVVQALALVPPRIDTPLLFSAPNGGYLDLGRFHTRTWAPAIRASGVPVFAPKDLRHVYASESLVALVDLFTLSRRMGTSLDRIDETYGHLVPDAVERELALLNAYDAKAGR